MNNQLSTINPKVTIHNGKAITTSFSVADYFGKRHDNVLRAIDNIDCSEKFTNLNFEVCFKNNELQNGKPQKYYQMTKDGFVFLVMGFTGKKAAQFKEAYIAEFSRMETELNTNLQDNMTYTEVIYVDKGKVVRTQRLEKGEIVASIEHFMQIARKAGYIVVSQKELLEKLAQ
ncbi:MULTISPECIES: Rha family transcriptional regulator [unclassified Arsenophonus]|uniref:Rha family transcriptional regulator n=1 Tax=unclassified Arsenophonus TaxID=2627083 RepID=UPI00285C528C|nr:Rha family transcriptional regulator [Arsenophonus sp.]MDR5609660.1 Rha family transcriptional regulator [Arsenophonus sp.]MDR5613448.1 Rha family transcriptional regulator [Arsenophonus sp.]